MIGFICSRNLAEMFSALFVWMKLAGIKPKKKKSLPDVYKRQLQMSLEKLTFLTNSLIKMSRLESGIIRLKPATTTTGEISKQAALMSNVFVISIRPPPIS